MLLAQIISEALKGKSLSRILSDNEIKKLKISGKVLDIGAFKNENTKITTINILRKKEKKPEIIADAEKLPFKDESFDCIVAFRVFEHIYDIKAVLREIKRILKKDGVFYAYIPFLYPYHADPHDYYRYTHKALKRIFKEQCFELKIIPLGYGPFSAGVLLFTVSMPSNFFINIFKSFLSTISIVCDLVFFSRSKKAKYNFALGYFILAKKIQS